jgi:hypothetical protein
MFDDFRSYFYQSVVTSFEEYQLVKSASPTGRNQDLQKAMVAASALFHLREHLPPSSSLNRTSVENLCSDYGLLGDIVNASKHGEISGSTPHGAPMITSATHLEEVNVITEYEDEKGIYEFYETVVNARLVNGTRRNVQEVMTNVMNFWQNHLHSLGIISRSRQYPLNHEPKSRAECEKSSRSLEIVPGLRLQQAYEFNRYNYTTHSIEPIDMTGHTARMVFQPDPKEFDFTASDDATGRTFTTRITLSDDEQKNLASLTTDSERDAYIQELPSVKHATKQAEEILAAEAKLV